MSRSNLSSWFGLMNALLIIFVFAQSVEIKITKIHMGILETRDDDRIVDEMEQVQSGGSLDKEEFEAFQRLQCSYALVALRHFLLTQELLYSSSKEVMYIRANKDHILFDEEAVLMLATVQSVPFPNLIENMPWSVCFYADRVHKLLESFYDGEVVDHDETKSMYKIHRAIVESLRLFLKSFMQFQDVQNKLHEINEEKIHTRIRLTTTIFENKKLLQKQIKFNVIYGISTDGIKDLQFDRITHFDKLDKIKSVVDKYLGRNYWAHVGIAICKMFNDAINVNIKMTNQILYFWHINYGIKKVLKLIVNKFVECYLDFSLGIENVKEIETLDKTMALKLTEFFNYVGRPSENDMLIQRFEKRENFPDFYNGVRGIILSENKSYPDITKIKNIFDHYYLLINDEKIMEISKHIQKWTEKSPKQLDSFVKKVKELFADINMGIEKTFYSYPIYAQSFKTLKRIDYPNAV